MMMLFNLFHGPKRRQNRQITEQSREVELTDGRLVVVRQRVECLGDGCPKPQLLTLKALSLVEPGEVVELVTDSVTAAETISAMMNLADGEYLATERDEGVWRVYIQRLANASAEQI